MILGDLRKNILHFTLDPKTRMGLLGGGSETKIA